MKVFFLSDLHLPDGESPSARRFVEFLEQEPKPGDVLILGGDIFDLLVGDKRVFRRRYGRALGAIEAAASRGVCVYYLEGNHDFHFTGIFRGRANLNVRFKDFELMVNGHKIWVSHGDLIDTTDKGYRLLRAVTKNALFRAFVAAVPDGFVDFVGNRSSEASRKYTSGQIDDKNTRRIRDLYLKFAKEKVRAGAHHVLVGHSHLRDQIPIVEGQGKGEYVNLGYFSDKLPFAVLEPGEEKFQLKERE
ncbi:MAG TPA: UDP-2,3-diacylglucosamine diphosphatase [Bdellovibrionota bacterium]